MHKLRSITQSTSDVAIIAADRDGIVITWNPGASKSFGYSEEEILGQPLIKIIPHTHREAHNDAFSRAVNSDSHTLFNNNIEVNGLHKGGYEFPCELSLGTWKQSGKKYFCAIIHDITSRSKTQEALRRKQKMEAIGELTGGLAHDFNNLLGIILGNLDLVSNDLDKKKLEKRIQNAKNSVLRSSDLTRRLLSFVRQSAEVSSAMNVNHLIVNLEELLSKSLTLKIAIETVMADDLWMVDINKGDLEDAIINLSINARDAMPDGGRLIIETSNIYLDKATSQPGENKGSVEYIEIMISDTGIGMSRTIKDKIFEPFFTTKKKDKGTGLGLAMVYSFVQRSKGFITVYSEEGKGSTFRICLPRSRSMAEQTEHDFTEKESMPRGSETILVVDDEVELISIAEEILQNLGYNVISALNGGKALEIINNDETIDRLCAHLVLPT